MKTLSTIFTLFLSFFCCTQVAAQAWQANWNVATKNPYGITQGKLLSSCNLVDLDADGDLDMLSSNWYATNSFTYYENTGTATNPQFAPAVESPFGLKDAEVGTTQIAIADLDADGDLDIFANHRYFENVGTPTAPQFAAPVSNAFGLKTKGNAPAFAFVDIDGDKDYDLLNTHNHYDYHYFENTGTPQSPQFAAPVDFFGLTRNLKNYQVDHLNYYTYPRFQDIDNDGDYDLYLGRDLHRDMLFIENTGTSTSPDFTQCATHNNFYSLSDPHGPHNDLMLDFGDLNGDGKVDMMYGTRSGNFYAQIQW